ncbi:hypothetical protein [Xanthomonas arboricola]|uniref:hypothetical protein n=1 Tax=Xanthomonas arboricola TaxID=56448 RepID=UPI00128FF1BF|nr:hypothetical protein [Xanthomonas arboricola]
MKVRPWLYLLALSIFPSSATAGNVKNEGDCYAVAKGVRDDGPVRVCVSLFPKLWARHDAGYIEVTGYIVYIDGSPFMFASKDLYVYSGGKSGIALGISLSEVDRFKRLMANDSAATVAGLYLPGYGERNSAIGRLEVIGQHYWVQEMPGERPQLPID